MHRCGKTKVQKSGEQAHTEVQLLLEEKTFFLAKKFGLKAKKQYQPIHQLAIKCIWLSKSQLTIKEKIASLNIHLTKTKFLHAG
jgi:hypothetical protein